jgi:hypothetical protein
MYNIGPYKVLLHLPQLTTNISTMAIGNIILTCEGNLTFADGGTDAMENMFYSIEFRIKDEIGKDARPYRSWWNNISPEWKY